VCRVRIWIRVEKEIYLRSKNKSNSSIACRGYLTSNQKVLICTTHKSNRYQWWSLETWSRSQDVSRDPFFGVSRSKASGFASVWKDFGLVFFVSKLCIGYFWWSFAGSSLEYQRGSRWPGSHEVIHVKLHQRASARFQFFSTFIFCVTCT